MPSGRAWLSDVITEIHERSRRTYGWRRIRAELADHYGQQVNKKLIRSIMAEHGISGRPARRKVRGCTRRDPDAIPSADLVKRQSTVEGPDRLWVSDIERHEALSNPAVVKGHRLQAVAAAW